MRFKKHYIFLYMKTAFSIKFTLVFILSNLINLDLCAQDNPYSNIRKVEINKQNSLTISDTLTIIPSSIKIQKSHSNFKLPYKLKNNRITIDPEYFELHSKDTLQLFYRVFPFNFERVYNIYNVNNYKIEDIAIPIEMDFGLENKKRRSLFSKGLNYNGSFSRGLSFGNSQSLVLNSQLNLQIDGDLGNGLKISAAISDDQIPIQPEGNTLILQEFDKVFIKISKDKNSLVAGDYELQSLPFKFAKYQKKMKGIKVQNKINLKDQKSISSTASFAISKGKFSRESIINIEGNQGPYQLRADNASRFLIIIAGSEKVFMDGKLLKRGESNDYIIDYNRSEITFTAKNLITKEKRIVVEYEYRDQSYLRSMYALQSEIKTKKLSFSVDFFTESDSKAISSNENIDSIDYEILINSGDDITKAVRTGVIPIKNIDDTYTEFYNKIYDSSISDSILVYATIPDSNSYQVFFSNVGSNNGSYEIDSETNSNGRTYKFVGINNGTYEPVKQLIAPQKKQMLSFGASYKMNKSSSLYGELSLSDFDHNRFSKISNNDNKGYAALFRFNNSLQLDSLNTWTLSTDLGSEIIHQNFNSINPFRNVEYNRDWNINDTNSKTQELLNDISVAIKYKNDFALRYGIKSFNRKSYYEGINHKLDLKLDLKHGGLSFSGNYLVSDDQLFDTKFFRPKIDAYINLDSLWRIGVILEHEDLNSKDILTSNLSGMSNRFDQYKLYLFNQSSKSLDLKFTLDHRVDYKFKDGILNKAYNANQLSLNGKWSINKSNLFVWDLSYRKLHVIDEQLSTNKSGQTILTNINYTLNTLKKAIKSRTTYQIGIGQEPLLEFSYEKVQPGEGNYKWKDFNKDQIEQINEFQEIIGNDIGDYIKISVFNDQFITTNKLEFTQNLKLEPSLYIGSSKKYRFLKKWSSNSSFRFRQKQTILEENDLIPFFKSELSDTSIFTHNGSIINTLFYNRGEPSYDFQLGQSSSANKLAQITGSELIKNNQYYVRNRVNLWKSTDLSHQYTFGSRNRVSEKFTDRNYNINNHVINSSISYRPNNNFRFKFSATYDYRHNDLADNNTTAKIKKLENSLNYKINTNSNIITDFKYVNIDYNGQINTPLYNVMLDGLNTGNNYIWSIAYTQKLRKNLYLFVKYNGRKTGNIDVIHTASAQVKASF